VRIDSHVHFWRYKRSEYDWIDDSMAALRRDFLPHDARCEMNHAGVDACVAVQAAQTVRETRWLLELAEMDPCILGVVGWVDLQADDVQARLAELAAHPRLVGVRHIVQSEPDDRFMLRPEFCRGISALKEFDLAYDILIYPKQLQAAAELVSRFTNQRFVLDHLAKPDIRSGEIRAWERDLRRLAGFPHVFCKLSGLVTEADWIAWTPDDIRPYVDVAFDSFGAERLMMGSDWPVCTVAGTYGRVVALIEDYLTTRPADESDAVMGGNAARFWGLRAGELV
jgi:L-fuconolactonase